MHDERAGRRAPRCHRPRWINLRRDIVELFMEAQEPLVTSLRTTRAQSDEYKSFMTKRLGFNKYASKLEHPTVRELRLRDPIKFRPKRLEAAFSCTHCSSVFQTVKAQRAHIIRVHGKEAYVSVKELRERAGTPRAIIYDGSALQAQMLKKSGWL